MSVSTPISEQLRSRAAAGVKASELVRWLRSHLAESFSVFDFVRYFKEAFAVPLGTLRDAEAWVGFSEDGTLTDEAFDRLLGPWLRKTK